MSPKSLRAHDSAQLDDELDRIWSSWVQHPAILLGIRQLQSLETRDQRISPQILDCAGGLCRTLCSEKCTFLGAEPDI